MKLVLLLCMFVGYVACAKKLKIPLPAESIAKLVIDAPPCIQETEVSPDILLQVREKRQQKDPAVQKFTLCMFKKLGLGDKKGTLVPDKVQAFCNMAGNEQLKNIVEECNKKVGENPSETASNVMACVQGKVDVNYGSLM